MEQNWEFRNKVLCLQSIDLQQRYWDNSIEKRMFFFFQHIVLGQLDSHMQKNEVETLSHNIYKNYSKWIIDLSVRVKTKTLSRITSGNLHDLGFSNDYKSIAAKQKLNDSDFIKILKFCALKNPIKKVKYSPQHKRKNCKLHI